MAMKSGDIRHLSRPDRWAVDLKLKVDGRPFTLDGREYVIQVMRDTSRKIVVKKAAQTAFTISFVVTAFHRIVERKWAHLYLLPLKQGAIPFAQKRIDPIINGNEYLKAQFTAVDNRLHKQTNDDISLLIRGTNVESEMQETPTDCIVFDEYDRMTTDWLEDAKHRVDGSPVKKLTYLSTPSVPGHGIDNEKMWWASDQHKWEIPCPGCGRFQSLNFNDHVRIGDDMFDCSVECEFCSRAFTDLERAALNKDGRWVATSLDGKFRGYAINQLNSPTVELSDIMEGFFEGQSDAKVLKSHFNQARGEPYVSPGDQISPELLDKCRDPAITLGGIPGGHIGIGIDVGHDDIYVEADVINRFHQRQLYGLWYFKDRPGKSAWEQLDEKVLRPIGSWTAVCDAHPDKRGARALSLKYPGRFWIGFERDRPDQEEIANWKKFTRGEAAKVIIDRTMAFDQVIHEMMTGNYLIPSNARELGEVMPRRDYNRFYSDLIQQVRVEEEDARGVVRAQWVANGNKDHYHHSGMFALIACMKRPRLRVPSGVGNAVKQAGTLVG